MIDRNIGRIFNHKHGELNFDGLLVLMRDSGLYFEKRCLNNALGLATFDCIYLDLDVLNLYKDEFIYFVVLHEIAHGKRIRKMGKEGLIKNMIEPDLGIFSNHILSEEIFADRYACFNYRLLNKKPYLGKTQELYLDDKKNKYLIKLKKTHEAIGQSEDKYNDLINSYINEI